MAQHAVDCLHVHTYEQTIYTWIRLLLDNRWRGKNKLGNALMKVRFILQSEAYGAEQDENEKKVKKVKAGIEKGKAGGKEEKEGEKGREKEKEENEKKTTTAKKKHSCAACLA